MHEVLHILNLHCSTKSAVVDFNGLRHGGRITAQAERPIPALGTLDLGLLWVLGLSKIMTYIEYVMITSKEYDYNMPPVVFSATRLQ